MSKEHFSELCNYDFTPYTQVNVCLASKDSEKNYNYELLIMSETLKEEFLCVVKSQLSELSRQDKKHNIELIEYDESTRPEKYEIEFLDSEQHQTIIAQLNSLSEYSTFTNFSNDNTFIEGLKFYAIAIDRDFYCFRIINKKKELGHSKWFGAYFNQDNFDKFEEKMLLFDDEIDCILYKKTLFVLNRRNFKWIFEFLEKLREVAIEALNKLEKTLPISNFEALRQIGESNQIVQMKLKSIASKPYINDLSIKDIKENIRLFPELNVEVIEKKGKEEIHFDPKNKWNFLRLVEDGCVHSVMTKTRYFSSDKRKV